MMCAAVPYAEPATGPLLMNNPKLLEHRKTNFMKYCYCMSHVGKKLLLHLMKRFYKGDPEEPYNTYFFENYDSYDYRIQIPISELDEIKTKSASDLDLLQISLLMRLTCSMYDEAELNEDGEDKYRTLKAGIDALIVMYIELGTWTPYLTDEELNEKLQQVNKLCYLLITEIKELETISLSEYSDITDDLTFEIMPLCTNPKNFRHGFSKKKIEENWAILMRNKEAAERALSTMQEPERIKDDEYFRRILAHSFTAEDIRQRRLERIADESKRPAHSGLSKKARKKLAREKMLAAKKKNRESHQSVESSKNTEPTASVGMAESEIYQPQTSEKMNSKVEAAKTQEKHVQKSKKAALESELSNDIKHSIPETTPSNVLSSGKVTVVEQKSLTLSVGMAKSKVNQSQTSEKVGPKIDAAKTQEKQVQQSKKAALKSKLSNNIKNSFPETTHSKVVSSGKVSVVKQKSSTPDMPKSVPQVHVAPVSPPRKSSSKGASSLSKQKEIIITNDVQAVGAKGKGKKTGGVQIDCGSISGADDLYSDKKNAELLFGSNKLHSSKGYHKISCFYEHVLYELDHEYSIMSNPCQFDDNYNWPLNISEVIDLPFMSDGYSGIIFVSGEEAKGKSMLLEYITEMHEKDIFAISALDHYPIIFHSDLKRLKCKTFQQLVLQFASEKGLHIGARKASFVEAVLDFPILLLLDNYNDSSDETSDLLRELFGMVGTQMNRLKIVVTCRMPYLQSLNKLVPKSKKRLVSHLHCRGFQCDGPYGMMEKLLDEALTKGEGKSSPKAQKIRKGLLSRVSKLFNVFGDKDLCNPLMVKILTEMWLENPLIE